MDLTQLHERLTGVIEEFDSLVLRLALETNSIVGLNTSQLWDGLDSEGNELRPRYSEDPFFKTQKAAKAYADWKQRITPNPKRNPDVPNLYINGYFYRSIMVKEIESALQLTTNDSFGSKVASEHRNALGLNKESLIALAMEIKPELLNQIRYELTGST